MASVAKVAGVSQGGQLHHFPTKDLIIIAAVEYAIANAENITRANLARYSAKRDVIKAIVKDCRDYYFSANFDVAMDITKSASGNLEIRRIIARLHRKYRGYAEESWRDILVKQGWTQVDAEEVIALTASLIRGFAIRTMLRNNQKEVDHYMGRWEAIVKQTYRGG